MEIGGKCEICIDLQHPETRERKQAEDDAWRTLMIHDSQDFCEDSLRPMYAHNTTSSISLPFRCQMSQDLQWVFGDELLEIARFVQGKAAWLCAINSRACKAAKVGGWLGRWSSNIRNSLKSVRITYAMLIFASDSSSSSHFAASSIPWLCSLNAIEMGADTVQSCGACRWWTMWCQHRSRLKKQKLAASTELVFLDGKSKPYIV